jgi:hypothetical protein
MIRINELPKDFQELALKRMKKQRGFKSEDSILSAAFLFSETKEGHSFWYDLQKELCNKKEIATIEVIEPIEVVSDSIVDHVISEFKDRSNVGIKKYGTTLDRDDLSVLEWIEHAKQEAMDMILYLEKLKRTL